MRVWTLGLSCDNPGGAGERKGEGEGEKKKKREKKEKKTMKTISDQKNVGLSDNWPK